MKTNHIPLPVYHAKRVSGNKLFEAAEAGWPEDEAALTFSSYQKTVDNEDEAYARERLQINVAHMVKCFGLESDAAELTARYLAELTKLGAPLALVATHPQA